MDTPQVYGSVDLSLKGSRGRTNAQISKTSSNNPDEALTFSSEKGQNSRVSAVYVLNQRGEPLMPTTPRKARKLLKEGKAKVKTRTPFVIQLLVSTGETKQPITLGVDAGYLHIGLSAVTENKEVYAAEVMLRSDIVNLLSERRAYRRNRRNRKTWCRQPRWNNRVKSKPKGWLAPSIRHKLDSHVKLVNTVKKILPIISVNVEIAAFDIQKIKNPDIQGIEYQEGVQKGFTNAREYVLYRDGHKCQVCKGKSKDKILKVVLNAHHIESRKTGGNGPDNLVTLCTECHKKLHNGAINIKIKPSKGFKAEAFMTMVWRRLVDQLNADSKYGYETKQARANVGLSKNHINDAFVIAGGQYQDRTIPFLIKQVRKQNRKLYKGPHSGVRNTAARFIHGFQRYDKVLYRGMDCFVFGRRSTGDFELRDLDGTKIHGHAKAKSCRLLETANTLLTCSLKETPPPGLKAEIFASKQL
ncbi:MAG: RNA-guided endonuclease IscB [Patescibacteria group bacterium]